jgi:hypothetical protein
MTDRTAVPERVSQRAKTARRGGPSGHQAVGDYVGQLAGEAAQAVRRAGLRPGLDRSFGCPTELIGLVVAQDPAAGSDMARNGMVTLYVAAPGSDPPDADAAPTTNGVPAAVEPVEPESSEIEPSEPMCVRRRKPGLARRSAPPPTFDPPPPPVVGGAIPAVSFAVPAVEAPGEWPAEIDAPEDALEDGLLEGPGELGFPHDEDFVVRVEDVFAGRAGPAVWRSRTYPRRRAMRRLSDGAGAVRVWMGEHRKLAGTIAAALAIWALVGLASALDRHHTRPTPPATVVSSRAPHAKHHTPAPVRNSIARKTGTGPARSHRSLPRPSHLAPRAPGPRRVPRAVRPAAAPVVREAVAPAVAAAPVTRAPVPQSSRAPAPPASTPPAGTPSSSPAPEQSGGGQFSP